MSYTGMAAAAPNVVVVCVNQYTPDQGKTLGEMYHRYDTKPVVFHSLFQMVGHIENFCDALGYPFRAMGLRSFQKEPPLIRHNYREAERVMSFSEMKDKQGKEATFMIHVQYRQNATWQGQITWVEKKRTSQFRSTLELLKLMDSAMQAEPDKD